MRILIIKASALGDIIQVFPCISYLRARFPEAEIDWAVEKPYADLLHSHPDIQRVIVLDTRKWRKNIFNSKAWSQFYRFRKELRDRPYDLIFDLQGNIKSACITALSRGSKKVGFGSKSVAERPNLWATNTHIDPPDNLPIQQKYLHLLKEGIAKLQFGPKSALFATPSKSSFKDEKPFDFKGVTLKLSLEDEARLEALLSLAKGEGDLVMVAFGSKWENKQLSFETLSSFLKQITPSPFFFFIYGSPQEKKVAEALKQEVGRGSAIGGLSLSLWQALMTRMSRVIAMDSAALHLCSTTNTPSFSVFGPSLASIYKPVGSQHAFIQGPCPYNVRFTKRCPKLRTCSTGACIKELKAGDLLQAFQKDVAVSSLSP